MNEHDELILDFKSNDLDDKSRIYQLVKDQDQFFILETITTDLELTRKLTNINIKRISTIEIDESEILVLGTRKFKEWGIPMLIISIIMTAICGILKYLYIIPFCLIIFIIGIIMLTVKSKDKTIKGICFRIYDDENKAIFNKEFINHNRDTFEKITDFISTIRLAQNKNHDLFSDTTYKDVIRK